MLRLSQRLIAPLSLCLLTLLVSCASTGDSTGSLRSDPLRSGELDELRVKRLPAEQLYTAAREALNSADYTTALQLYDRLDAQFPFTRYATQGKLESIFAHYRAYQPDLALSAADRFLRANPRHEQLDYVLYLRGLVNFDRGATDIMDALDMDSASRDPINARRAFEDFGRLIQRFPTSDYAADARQRMVYLRERIAQHEMAITRYYVKRRAWVAASRRAQSIISKFQGSAVMPEALDILATCYEKLQLADRAAEIRAVRAASFPQDVAMEAAKPAVQIEPPPAPAMPAPAAEEPSQDAETVAPQMQAPESATEEPARRSGRPGHRR